MKQTSWIKVAILIFLFAVSSCREIKVKHKDNLAVYNHTLATILVEYASAYAGVFVRFDRLDYLDMLKM